jgi:hypothetical protein
VRIQTGLRKDYSHREKKISERDKNGVSLAEQRGNALGLRTSTRQEVTIAGFIRATRCLGRDGVGWIAVRSELVRLDTRIVGSPAYSCDYFFPGGFVRSRIGYEHSNRESPPIREE